MAAEWIAVDWGTSNLRAWVMGADGKPVAHETSDMGMAHLSPEAFEPALLQLLEPHLTAGERVTVLCCGMVGARQGWSEAPYCRVPCLAPVGTAAVRAPGSDTRLDVRILPGVMQADPPDVMRGEETQIGGYLALHPTFDGVLCLPGTHTKWARVSAGEIVGFRTFLTGELFSLLSEKSVLRHSVTGDGWDNAAFEAAVADAMSAPQHFASRLFSIRAGSLLADIPAAQGRARLSGLLLGLELAGARGYWLGENVALVGDTQLCALYASALGAQGVPATTENGEDMVLAGLTAAFASLKGSPDGA